MWRLGFHVDGLGFQGACKSASPGVSFFVLILVFELSGGRYVVVVS